MVRIAKAVFATFRSQRAAQPSSPQWSRTHPNPIGRRSSNGILAPILALHPFTSSLRIVFYLDLFLRILPYSHLFFNLFLLILPYSWLILPYSRLFFLILTYSCCLLSYSLHRIQSCVISLLIYYNLMIYSQKDAKYPQNFRAFGAILTIFAL